ncbi:MAG: BTAD domain-containing putative transcriptional regulator [Longimicrobiales bacterium]|nr:BTAD domain-containing putative transcriptional regulator [Longimicrobiales bacterium]
MTKPTGETPGKTTFRLDVLGLSELSEVSEADETSPVTLQPKRFALLAYLVLARPRGFQRRDSLLALFWPDSGERKARNALNQALHGVRSALGEDVVLSRGLQQVGIAREPIECDAVAFEEAFADERFADALDLYSGRLLEGFHVRGAPAFERWLDGERRRLARQARAAAITLADRRERAGNPVGAARWLERALEVAPTDESLMRRFVSALDRAGDRSGALRAYERIVDDLRDRYGIEPSPESRALVSEIRDRTEGRHPEDGTGGPISQPKAVRSLAVLPLTDLRDEPDRVYFADGMTEALIGELARISPLRVISRQSVLGFKGSERPLVEIGDALGVDAVLEGSVLRVKNRVRLSLQLLRVDPEEHLWAEAFERDLGDVLALQRDVARAVAEQVEGVVTSPDGDTVSWRRERPRTVDPAAYDSFLRGVAQLARQRPEDFAPAIASLREAVEHDPEFGEPLAWIALAYANMVTAGLVSPDELDAPMRDAARRAMELDDRQSPAHLAQALTLQLFERDWKGAHEAYRRAAEAPGGTVHEPWKSWLVMFLVGQGRFEEALELARSELRRDPIGPTAFLMGWAFHKARRFEDSIERLEWVHETWPDYPIAVPFLAASRLFAGRIDEAVEAARHAVNSAPRFQTGLAYGAAVFGRAGEVEEARRLADRVSQPGPDVYVDPFNVAVARAGLGDQDGALEALDRLVEEGSPQSWIVAPEPFFDPLRDDQRFDVVLERLDLPRLDF